MSKANLQIVKTSDGSYTLRHPLKGHYHSLSGAKEEALKTFVLQAIKELTSSGLGNQKLIALDFCFGLGYNTAALINEFKGNELTVYGLENDRSLLEKIQKLPNLFGSYRLIKRLLKKNPVIQGSVKIQLLFGDAKEQIKNVPEQFDICFYDPFSPTVEPDLWTEECFKLVFNKMKSGGVLITYSCARKVRENIQSAGFAIKDGHRVGRGKSTIGLKS